MLNYTVNESDQFLKDVEEIAIWILVSNIEQSESLAEKKVDEFNAEIIALKARLRVFPESGDAENKTGIRNFPLYAGRYSAKWIIDNVGKTVNLIAIVDSKYPKSLREIYLDDDFEEE
jgi:hypothetical protein